MNIPSIRVVILLLAMVPALVTGLVLSTALTQIRFNDISKEIENRTIREARYLAQLAAFGLLVRDTDQLSRLANASRSAQDSPVAVVFLDENQAAIASSGTEDEVARVVRCAERQDRCTEESDRLVFSVPVTTGGEAIADSPLETDVEQTQQVGTVLLSYPGDQVWSLQKRHMETSAVLTLSVLIVTGLVARAFARRIATPIFRLYECVHRIRAGDLSARVEPTGGGEIRTLENGINAMAESLERSTADLAQRIEEATIDLEQRNAQLDDALQARSQFLSRMSHEMRTPLTSVVSCVRLMTSSPTPPVLNENLPLIQVACGLLRAIIDDVLALERLSSGSASFNIEKHPFDLHRIVKNIASLIRPTIHGDAKNVSVVVELAEDLPKYVQGDERHIAQVLFNLVGNAVKFTQVGEVRIRLRRGGADRVEFRITDTGIGISPQQQARLFQPFAQADESTSRRFGGSGLGLAIARSMVEAMGGTLELASEEYKGTTVTAIIPLPELTASDVSSRQAGKVTDAPVNARLLLVEDNDLNRRLIAAELSNLGASVEWAESGPRALEALSISDFDLVVTDLHMPDMDGSTLASRIRQRWPHVPVYALTADVVGTDDRRLAEAGVRGIFRKPFDEEEVRELLSALSGVSDPIEMLRDDVEGVSRADIVCELRTLLSRLESNMTKHEDIESWISISHEMLGVARLFCRGPILSAVSRLHRSLNTQPLWVVGYDLALVTDQLTRVEIGM